MRPALLILSFIISQLAGANKVDSLQTDSNVLAFCLANGLGDRSFSQLEIKPTDLLRKKLTCDGVFEKWKIRNWEKADFNQDGNMDLLIIVSYRSTSSIIGVWPENDVVAAIDNGNNTFKIIDIPSGLFAGCRLFKPLWFHQKQLLLFYHTVSLYTKKNIGSWKVSSIEQTDTLLYKDGVFMELNEHPTDNTIRSIRFSTTECYGSCPIFELRINKNGKAAYNAIRYNPTQGEFYTTLKKENYDKIVELVNYIDIKKLRDYYSAGVTDMQGYRLSVTLGDGSIKEIYDYARSGPLGLGHLYDLFFALRTSQNWK